MNMNNNPKQAPTMEYSSERFSGADKYKRSYYQAEIDFARESPPKRVRHLAKAVRFLKGRINKDMILNASQRYKVPAKILCAIIGTECPMVPTAKINKPLKRTKKCQQQ